MRTTTPSHRARRLAAVLMAGTTLVAMTACSSDSKASPKSDTTTATTTDAGADTTVADTGAPTTTTKTTTPETTPDTTEETVDTTDETVDTTDETVDTTDDTTGTGDIEAAIKELLLTPDEVGPTFVEDTYTPGDGTTPCGLDVDGQVPPLATTGTQIDSADPLLAMVEEIKVYNSDADATQAFTLATTGFACGEAEGVQLGDLTDVSDQLGIEAYALTIASDSAEGVLFLAHDSDAIVVLQFQQEVGAEDVPGVPDPTTVATKAIDKIKTLLNG